MFGPPIKACALAFAGGWYLAQTVPPDIQAVRQTASSSELSGGGRRILCVHGAGPARVAALLRVAIDEKERNRITQRA
jgi:hypothetical protein